MNNQEKNTYVRTQLLNSLLEMMKEQDFQTIAIQDLTSRAQVGRASFYHNYSSKEDILKQETERLSIILEKLIETKSPSNPSETLLIILDFYKEHSDFYLTLHQSGMLSIILESLINHIHITKETPNIEAYLKSSIAYMLYGWIIEWINRGMQESGTELANIFRQSNSLNPITPK